MFFTFMMNSFSAKEAEFEERVSKIARDADEFEGYKNAHAARLAALADALAKTFNLASHDRYSLRQAALVHDVGEAVMNRDYIKAGRKLREDERVDMQRHPIIGEQEAAKRGLSRAVQLLIRWHHEWWNGAGYPDALEREQIPLAARILRVCDTFCALTADRPYRAAFSEAEAKRYLTEWAAIEFDPKIVKTFLALEELKEAESFADEEQIQITEQLPMATDDSENNNERFAADAESFFIGDEQSIAEENDSSLAVNHKLQVENFSSETVNDSPSQSQTDNSLPTG